MLIWICFFTLVFLTACGMMVNSAVLPEANTVNSPFPNVEEYVVTAERLNVRDNMGVVVRDIYYLRGDVVIIREIADGWGKIAEDRWVWMEWLEAK
jgi:hypothetical protein